MDKLVRNLVFFLILLVLEYLLLFGFIYNSYEVNPLADFLLTLFCITVVGYFVSQFIYAGIIAGKKHLEFINGKLHFVLIVYVAFVGLILWSGRARPYTYNQLQIIAYAFGALILLGMYTVAFFVTKDRARADNLGSMPSDVPNGIKLDVDLDESSNSKNKNAKSNGGLILDNFSEEDARHSSNEQAQEITDPSKQETLSQTQSTDLEPIQGSSFSGEDKLAFERAKKYEKRLGLRIKPVRAKLQRVEVIKARIPSFRQYFDKYIKNVKKTITNDESFATRLSITTEFLEDIGYYTLNLLFNEVKIKKGLENEVKNEEVVQYFLENYSSLTKLIEDRVILDAWLESRREKFCKCAFPNYDELRKNERNCIKNELDNLQSRSILFALDVFGPLFDIDFNEEKKEKEPLEKNR